MVPWHLKHEKYGVKPWSVQEEALRLSEGKTHFGYFLEMGLGKTALILNDFLHYYKAGKVNFLLVLCPNSFKLSWVNALSEWHTGLRGGMWPKDDALNIKQNFNVYVVNWEAIRTAAGLEFLQKLFRHKKVFLALDETSFIKNPAAQVTKRAILISKQAVMVRELNGTPQTKNNLDYYSQLKVLQELNGKTMYGFRARYCRMGGYMNYQIIGTQNDDELGKILNRVSFRAKKADWRKDLPPRVITTVPLEMTKKQLAHYKEMQQEFMTIVEGQKITATLVLTQMLKLRQISSCLVKYGEGEDDYELIEEPKANPKVKAALDIVNNQDGKVIIVYNFKPTLRVLEEAFTAEGIPFAYIKGQMKPAEIEEQKMLFNEDPNYKVIFTQQAAACMGHTLIGTETHRCSTMIFVENSLSVRDRLQMLDRNHRGAQDQACTVYDLVTSNTEKKLIRNLDAQKSAADDLDAIIASMRSGYNPYAELKEDALCPA